MESNNGSLANALANLLTPAPAINDAEIDSVDVDSAKLATRDVEDDDGIVVAESKLRRSIAPILGDVDSKYAGKTISRKAAMGEGDDNDDDDDDDEQEEDEDDDDEEEEDDDDDDDNDDDDEVEKSNVKNGIGVDSDDEIDPEFKKILMAGNSTGVEDEDDEEMESSDDDDDGDDVDAAAEKEGEQEEEREKHDVPSTKEGGKKEKAKNESKSEETQLKLFEKKLRERHEKQEKEDRIRKDMLKKAQTEKLKGMAVKQQLKLWDSFLEIRIRLQKGLDLVNRLPQPHDSDDKVDLNGIVQGSVEGDEEKSLKNEFWSDFVRNVKSEERPKLEKCQKSVQNLSQSILKLQTTLLSSVDETRAAVKTSKALNQTDQILEKRHQMIQKFRDETLTKWQEKTAMTSAKSFHAFDTPILDQINLILSDKDRLLKRTRTNRQNVVVLGKRKKVAAAPDENGKDDDDDDDGVEEMMDKRKKDRLDVEIDDQIFDDSDFYQHLLRELIERKSSQITDSHALGKQMVQLHKLRIRNKRKVDTRASKGRKVRYDTHQKLIGFTASVTTASSMSDSARDELFKSLFGQRWSQSKVEDSLTEPESGKSVPQEE